jgi:hypothetical protein
MGFTISPRDYGEWSYPQRPGARARYQEQEHQPGARSQEPGARSQEPGARARARASHQPAATGRAGARSADAVAVILRTQHKVTELGVERDLALGLALVGLGLGPDR